MLEPRRVITGGLERWRLVVAAITGRDQPASSGRRVALGLRQLGRGPIRRSIALRAHERLDRLSEHRDKGAVCTTWRETGPGGRPRGASSYPLTRHSSISATDKPSRPCGNSLASLMNSPSVGARPSRVSQYNTVGVYYLAIRNGIYLSFHVFLFILPSLIAGGLFI